MRLSAYKAARKQLSLRTFHLLGDIDMDGSRARSLPVLLLAFVVVFSTLLQAPVLAASSKQAYVVYLGEHSHAGAGLDVSPEVLEKATESHYDLLGFVLGDKEKAREAIFYSYTRHINGFAANLDAAEAAEIAKQPGVVSVFPNRGHKLHTTRSWQFLGLEANHGAVPPLSAWRAARFGEDTIIGNLDTGVWPESESFRDDDLGPIPSQWKGSCQNDQDKKFSCNRKLIGARYFNKGYASSVGVPLNSTFYTPRDINGHGTHTLSTAGGSFVPGASVVGYGAGTAKGGSPRARVAGYRVCFPPINGSECFDADILSAFDAAIHDGVHVLSVSLGGEPTDYFNDGLAIGSFHAVKSGVTVVCSAGNSGPTPGSVSNVAPWIFTAGASTMDREFPSFVVFNHTHAKGQSLSEKRLSGKRFYPMISAADAFAPNRTQHDAQLCYLGSLDPEKVKGKIVVCLRGTSARVEKGEAVRQAGGAAMVLANDVSTGNEIIADAHVLPATHIAYSDGLRLFAYLNSTKSAAGFVTKPNTNIGTKPAPFMAAFSSQGPNTVNPQILKPDITAPGVSVIAAWSGENAPTDLAFDPRRVKFNSESGTSMSCPHVSGVVGLVKTLHPDWSPAAIKSAIMTTASMLDNKLEPILNASFVTATPFSYGSGQVWPDRALDPGLVYDLTTADYLNFLCALRYNSTALGLFTGGSPYKCPRHPLNLQDLNYPSITVYDLTSFATVKRTVKNVGCPGTYRATVVEPKGVAVAVHPAALTFSVEGEEKHFEVAFRVKDAKAAKDYAFGALVWSDGKHFVRSPLVVKTRS